MNPISELEQGNQELRDRLTGSLNDWCDGDDDALECLWNSSYEPLLVPMAKKRLKREQGLQHLIESRDLVNRVYMKLASIRKRDFRDLDSFFGHVLFQMNRVIVDRARVAKADRRGGQKTEIPVSKYTDII